MNPDAKRERACSILTRLGTCLDLSREDIATMFGATGDVVVAWERGREEVPELVFARMIAAGSALDRLVQLFQPARLPQVIRRRAPAFDNERALDWILDGRIADVAMRYDEGLAFLVKKSA